MMPLDILLPFLKRVLLPRERLYFLDACWCVVVVDIRIVVREALGAEEFLVIKCSVRFAELRMPLRGYLSQAMIRWHSCVPPYVGGAMMHIDKLMRGRYAFL